MTLFPTNSSPPAQKQRPRLRASVECRRGAAAVEFALVAPIFAILILGTLASSRGMMVKHVLSDAAIKACRTGILPGADNAAILSAAQGVLKDNDIDVQTATITILVNERAVNARTAVRNDRITVTVSVPASRVLWSPPHYLTGKSITSESITMMRQG